MKNYVFILVLSLLFITGATNVFAAEQKSLKQSDSAKLYPFQEVNEESLTEVEKVFVNYAKQQKGIYQFGSLYVIALGEKPNPGYGLKFEKQVQTLEQLQIYVKQTVPIEGMSYPEVISYPYIVGRLQLPPYTTLSVLDIDSKKPFSTEQTMLLDFMDQRVISDPLKEWSIMFNKSVTEEALEKNYRISMKKWEGYPIDHKVKVAIDAEKKDVVKVQPLERYEKDATYLLEIENIRNGKRIILPFTVSDR